MNIDDLLAGTLEDLSKFKLGWRWPKSETVLGMQFGRTDLPPHQQFAVTINPTAEDGSLAKFDRDSIARRVFDGLLTVERKIRLGLQAEAGSSQGQSSNEIMADAKARWAKEAEVKEAIFSHVRAHLDPIVDQIIERATKAHEGREVVEHNRKVRLHKLIEPIQEALWDGVSVEEILNVAKVVQTKGRSSRPTLEEVFAGLAEDHKKRQQG